jgi:proline racemase
MNNERISTVHSSRGLKIKINKNEFFILLLILSYNILKQSQNNAVVVQQEKMDRVGVEPTTSASLAALCTLYLKGTAMEK